MTKVIFSLVVIVVKYPFNYLVGMSSDGSGSSFNGGGYHDI
jgi:hypothetical protein